MFIIEYYEKEELKTFEIHDEIRYTIRKNPDNSFKIQMFLICKDFQDIVNSSLNQLYETLKKENIKNIVIYQIVEDKKIKIYELMRELSLLINNNLNDLSFSVIQGANNLNPNYLEAQLSIGG